MPYDPLSSVQQPVGTPTLPNSPMLPGMVPGMGAPNVPNPYGIDPKVLEALLGTYGDQLNLSGLDKQLEQANALRGGEGPQGRDSGRVFTAANPLEFIGKGIGQYRMMKKAHGIEDEQKKLRTGIGEKVATYGKNVPR